MLSERDINFCEQVAVINETAAKLWPVGIDPIGRRMYGPNDITHGDLTAINEKTVFYTVVGVIGDMKLHDLTEGGFLSLGRVEGEHLAQCSPHLGIGFEGDALPLAEKAYAKLYLPDKPLPRP